MDNKQKGTIPAKALAKIDYLEWEDTTQEALFGFTIDGTEDNGPSGVTLYGFYPLAGVQHYLIIIYPDDEIAGLRFQRAAVV